MKQYFRRSLMLGIAILSLLAFTATAPAQAQIQETLDQLVAETDLPYQDEEVILEETLIWLLGIFTILAVLSFVISGVMFLFAGANKNLADKAKDGVTYSIIGIVVALIGYIIIKLIFDLLNATPSIGI